MTESIVATVDSPSSLVFGCCHGYDVDTEDGRVGVVETPLFPPDSDEPDHLVVRVYRQGRLFPGFHVVPVSLVTGVDEDARAITIGVSRAVFDQLPEDLPLAV